MPKMQRWVGTDMEDDMEGEHSGNEEHSMTRFGVDSRPSLGFLGGSDKWGPFIPDTVTMVIVTSNEVF
jgi:hypothetical protein